MKVSQIATALFKEFGKATDRLNKKGEKKWELPDIKDGLAFRQVLMKILKKNGGCIVGSVEDAKKDYKSGSLKKAYTAMCSKIGRHKSKKSSSKKLSKKSSSKKTSKKTSKKASKKASKKSSK